MIDEKRDARARARRMGKLHQELSSKLVDFLVELAEFDRLRRHEVLGYARIGHFLADEYLLEDGQIYYRVSAARVIQRAPIAVEYLRDERVCMTRLSVLRDVINAENAKELLDRSTWKSKNQIAEIVVALKPKEAHDPAQKIRKTPGPKPRVVEAPAGNGEAAVTTEAAAPPLVLVAPPVRIEPVAEDRFGLPLRFDREFKATFERVAAILSHAIPDGDPAKIFRYGMELVLQHEAKRHCAPRKDVRVGDGRAIPIDLERRVWTRDESKCVWQYDSGRLCGSTWQLQIDHILALALGGKTELENLRLLCRDHNLLHERLTFGSAFVERKIEEASAGNGR